MNKPYDYAPSILRLLKGSINSESDAKIWKNLLDNEKSVREHFEKLGIFLHLDREDGYAFLRQTSDDESAESDEKLPVITRKLPLTKEETLFLILLRECIIEIEEKDPSGSILFRKEELSDKVSPFFSDLSDEIDRQKRFEKLLRKSEELGFVKQIEPETIRIERLLKAKLTVSELEGLRGKFRLGTEKR
ncbi:DUF4194 domain-containing protein [Leptospira santarosai]|nr:DUF4194 domain-containing protein [Leptospira santarosai]